MYSNEDLKTQILRNYNQLELFRRFLGYDLEVGKLFCSPKIFRVDNYPTCTLNYTKTGTGILYYRDWSEPQGYNIFDMVMRLYNVSFNQACLKIMSGNTANPISIEERVRIKREKSFMRIKRKEFKTFDTDYWMQYLMNEKTLTNYEVSSLDTCWINDNIAYKHHSQELAYVYYYGGYEYKCYFPGRTKGKSLHVNPHILQGYSQLPAKGDLLVITKSQKDVMCLHEYGINAVAPVAESILLQSSMYEHLKSRFPTIVSLYDRDRAGVTMAKLLKKTYNIQAILFGKNDPKDFSDCIKEEGRDSIIDRIEYTKERILCQTPQE